MLIDNFDYELPEDLIAQHPLVERSRSRMLVVDRKSQTFNDSVFLDLPSLIVPGDLIVLNNTKVFPARLKGISETGAKIELFLIKQLDDGNWESLARPARRLKPGKKILFSENLSAEVITKTDEGHLVIYFKAFGDLEQLLDQHGETPLPPYIKRGADALHADRDRYQTVYAKERGAIAAPTAGLHFTPAIIEALEKKGAEFVEITLHVGYGTFEPVRVSDLAEHRVMAERYEISDETAEKLNAATLEKRRIIAVGTTTTRALETSINKHGIFRAEKGFTDLTIKPGYEFKAIDALLTNFHLPKSSLLVLVSTFAAHTLIMNAYLHAVSARYRFYSYGDCMFIK